MKKRPCLCATIVTRKHGRLGGGCRVLPKKKKNMSAASLGKWESTCFRETGSGWWLEKIDNDCSPLEQSALRQLCPGELAHREAIPLPMNRET